MRTVRPVKSGEELLNDYGPLPRAELLRRYGYVCPQNAKYDVAELPRELLVQEIQAYRPVDKDDLDRRVCISLAVCGGQF